MNRERFEKQLAFILEADKEKNILRQTHLTGHGRRENDAEHAWHMAMMIYLLKEYSNKEIDVAKAMMMALVHDIVEIDAGDTYAYDTKGLESQKEREERAAERIFGILPTINVMNYELCLKNLNLVNPRRHGLQKQWIISNHFC